MSGEAHFDATHPTRFSVGAGYLPRNRAVITPTNLKLKARAKAEAPPIAPSVAAMAELFRRDGVVRMLVSEMIDQAPPEHKTVDDIEELLAQLNIITRTAPEWETDPENRVFFPMSALFTYMMMTVAGEAAFRNRAFNASILRVLAEWCAYLDSPESAHVLNEGPHGWLSPPAYAYNELENFVIPDRSARHWGWRSWNDFFHREIKAEVRPIANPGDPRVVVSPNDGTVYKAARDVAEQTTFWIKGQPYSLFDMLNSDPIAKDFAGGDVLQSYLSGADYHRWHAPVSGKVMKAEVVPGLTFSNLESEGNDIKGTGSQGYYTSVNARGILMIEADHKPLGTVVVMPVGITEVSSIRHTVAVGDHVEKGQEIGRFSYGGSSLATIYQPGALNHFTVFVPDNPKDDGKIKVNSQIAVAN